MGSHEPELPRPAVRSRRAGVGAAMDAIRRIVRALRVSSSAAEKSLGISSAQLFVLQQLADDPRPSIAHLAAATATDPSSVSVVVSRLVERGLALRRASKLDARRAEVMITPAGRALLRKAPEPAQAKLINALSALSPEQLVALIDGLDTVVETMGVASEVAPMFFEDEPDRQSRIEED
jgi:DNA-binding MarR family transcriptional regulator